MTVEQALEIMVDELRLQHMTAEQDTATAKARYGFEKQIPRKPIFVDEEGA